MLFENKKIIDKNKVINAIKEQETKEKKAKDISDKLLEEETAKKKNDFFTRDILSPLHLS